MKLFYFLFVCLFVSINVNAQDKVLMDNQANDCLSSKVTDARQDTGEELIYRQITVKLDKAGTLYSKIGSERQYKITNLKIVGEINGDDFLFMHSLASCFENSDYVHHYGPEPNLSILDLSEAKIVEGGYNIYWYGNSRAYYANNDVVGDYFFENCEKLKSIILPNGITSIGSNAFEKCSGLTNVIIPSGVSSIGRAAFKDCSALSDIVLPDGLTSLGDSVFAGCSALSNMVLPNSISIIGKCAFCGCSVLSNVTIPFGVVSIGLSTFEACFSLNNVIIPSSVTSIGDWAFANCNSLSNVIIPSSITSIGGYAFANCNNLSRITIPSNVTTIPIYAFYGCRSLSSVIIPSSVSGIGNRAFGGCSSLANIYLSWKTPVPITRDVFADVDAKTCKVYIPKGTYDDYFISNWGEFDNLIEYDVTGIDNASAMKKAKELMRYSINGQRFYHQAKGLNIVKYSDGSVRKEIVK